MTAQPRDITGDDMNTSTEQPTRRVDMNDPEHVAWRDQLDAAVREHEAQQDKRRR